MIGAMMQYVITIRDEDVPEIESRMKHGLVIGDYAQWVEVASIGRDERVSVPEVQS